MTTIIFCNGIFVTDSQVTREHKSGNISFIHNRKKVFNINGKFYAASGTVSHIEDFYKWVIDKKTKGIVPWDTELSMYEWDGKTLTHWSAKPYFWLWRKYVGKVQENIDWRIVGSGQEPANMYLSKIQIGLGGKDFKDLPRKEIVRHMCMAIRVAGLCDIRTDTRHQVYDTNLSVL